MQVPDRLVGKAAQVVPERRWLRGLQVGAVRPQRGGVLGGPAARLGGEPRDVGVQPEQALPQTEPERDPARFPAGSAQVQSSGRRTQRPLEFPFPAVVRVAVERVVAEFRGRRVKQAEQPAAQRGGLPGPQRPALGQRDQVSQIGQGEAAVQQRGVRDLQRVAGLDQFRRGPAGDPGVGAQVAPGGAALPSCRPAVRAGEKEGHPDRPEGPAPCGFGRREGPTHRLGQ